jgi:hypothetical protein
MGVPLNWEIAMRNKVTVPEDSRHIPVRKMRTGQFGKLVSGGSCGQYVMRLINDKLAFLATGNCVTLSCSGMADNLVQLEKKVAIENE